MASIEQIKQLALGITRSLTTEQIVEAFDLTDVQLDEIRALPMEQRDNDRHIDLIQARGWMMEVLEERGQLDLIMGDEPIDCPLCGQTHMTAICDTTP